MRFEHHLDFVLAGGPGLGLPWIPRDGYKLFIGWMKTGPARREMIKIFLEGQLLMATLTNEEKWSIIKTAQLSSLTGMGAPS